jgi:hypothetical protein
MILHDIEIGLRDAHACLQAMLNITIREDLKNVFFRYIEGIDELPEKKYFSMSMKALTETSQDTVFFQNLPIEQLGISKAVRAFLRICGRYNKAPKSFLTPIPNSELQHLGQVHLKLDEFIHPTLFGRSLAPGDMTIPLIHNEEGGSSSSNFNAPVFKFLDFKGELKLQDELKDPDSTQMDISEDSNLNLSGNQFQFGSSSSSGVNLTDELSASQTSSGLRRRGSPLVAPQTKRQKGLATQKMLKEQEAQASKLRREAEQRKKRLEENKKRLEEQRKNAESRERIRNMLRWKRSPCIEKNTRPAQEDNAEGIPVCSTLVQVWFGGYVVGLARNIEAYALLMKLWARQINDADFFKEFIPLIQDLELIIQRPGQGVHTSGFVDGDSPDSFSIQYHAVVGVEGYGVNAAENLWENFSRTRSYAVIEQLLAGIGDLELEERTRLLTHNNFVQGINLHCLSLSLIFSDPVLAVFDDFKYLVAHQPHYKNIMKLLEMVNLTSEQKESMNRYKGIKFEEIFIDDHPTKKHHGGSESCVLCVNPCFGTMYDFKDAHRLDEALIDEHINIYGVDGSSETLMYNGSPDQYSSLICGNCLLGFIEEK